MEDSQHPFNYPEGVERALNDFKHKDWTNKSLQDVSAFYKRTFQTVPSYLITMKKGTILFRARKNENDQLFPGIDQISIKRKELVDSLGRANFPYESIFYASTNEETVVREVTQWYINDNGRFQDLITKGITLKNWSPFTSMMTISAWIVDEDLNLALLFSGSNEGKRSTAIQEFAKDRHVLKNGMSEDYLTSCNLILDFFSNEFGKLDVRHQYDYLYSALYANQIYSIGRKDSGEGKFDGVKYVSIANDFRGENIAITENAFRKKIRFIGANYCYTYNNYNKKIENNAIGLIGRVYAGMLNDDETFNWINSSDEFDYLMRTNAGYFGFKLPAVENQHAKTCKTIYFLKK